MISISHIYSDQPSFIYREVFSTVLFKHLDALGKEIHICISSFHFVWERKVSVLFHAVCVEI